jgi:hypothetical protein
MRVHISLRAWRRHLGRIGQLLISTPPDFDAQLALAQLAQEELAGRSDDGLEPAL